MIRSIMFLGWVLTGGTHLPMQPGVVHSREQAPRPIEDAAVHDLALSRLLTMAGETSIFSQPGWPRRTGSRLMAGGVGSSVKDFGARGEGITDDTSAVQTAIDSLPASGGLIYFPRGKYRVTRTLRVSPGRSVRLAGSGMRSSIIDWRGPNNQAVIQVDASVTTSGVALEELTISNSAVATGVSGVSLGPVAGGGTLLHTRIIRMLFRGLDTGIRLYDETDELTVQECWFFDLAKGVVGASVGRRTNSNLLFLQNQFQGVRDYAIDLDNGSQHVFLRNTIQGTAPTQKGIRVDRFDSVVVLGNYFESSTAGGSPKAGPFLVLGPSSRGAARMSGALVAANHVDFGTAIPGQIAIGVDHADGVTITNNAFRAVDKAIQLTAHASKTMIGPQVWGDGVKVRLEDLGAGDTLILDASLGHAGIQAVVGHFQNAGGKNRTDQRTVIQRGIATIPPGQRSVDVKFPVPFSTSDGLTIQVSTREVEGTVWKSNVSASGFTIRREAQPIIANVDWLAIGVPQ